MRRASTPFLRVLQMFLSSTAKDCLAEGLTGVTVSPRLSRPRTSLSRGKSGKAIKCAC